MYSRKLPLMVATLLVGITSLETLERDEVLKGATLGILLD